MLGLRSCARNTGAGSGDMPRVGIWTGTALGSLFDRSFNAWMRLVIPELTILLCDALEPQRSPGNALLEGLSNCGSCACCACSGDTGLGRSVDCCSC